MAGNEPKAFCSPRAFPERRNEAVDCFNVLHREPVREAVDPRRLQAHRRIERVAPVGGQHDELRAPMMRVWLERDELFLVQVVDDPLHVLAIRPQVPCQPRHWLWTFSADDGAEDLPACAGQPEPGHEARHSDQSSCSSVAARFVSSFAPGPFTTPSL